MAMDATEAVQTGDDGRARCWWSLSAPEYVAYHDREWGRPVVTDAGLFERLTLEAFQSGLSWLTILRKREAFRAAFAGFDVAAVARFGPADVERLLGDAGIVRNRRKIEATVANAGAALAIVEEHGGLPVFFWRYRPEARPAPVCAAQLASSTPEATALAKDLRRRGFVFVGPTTAYSLMQAAGIVNDHLSGCWVGAEVEREQTEAARSLAAG
jgi:DNA-3-methyladenine glycosylase I